jgi:hypothetical protein
MVHVPSTTSILNHSYTAVLGVPAPGPRELAVINSIVVAFSSMLKVLGDALPVVSQVADVSAKLRSLPFLLATGCLDEDAIHLLSSPISLPSSHVAGASGDEDTEDNNRASGIKINRNSSSSSNEKRTIFTQCQSVIDEQLARFESLPFVRYLMERAVGEVRVFARHGIRLVEIENVAAPYFVGMGSCPLEELLAIFVVSRAVRLAFPALSLGVHVLSCNELEALPIALAVGASFIRSEATLFGGMRPEGPTDNHGNLARFFYLRHILRGLLLPSSLQRQPFLAGQDVYPKIWSDVQK